MSNPLLHPSELPFGLPDFATISCEDVREALLLGMAQEKEQWRAIGSDRQPATVDNTVGAIDAAGALLGRATAVFYTLLSSIGGDEYNSIYEELAPRFAEHEDSFWMDKAIYDRCVSVATLPDLDPETRWFTDELVAGFKRSGVSLPAAQKDKLRDLNAKIAALQAQVDARITKQLERTFTTGTDTAELRGLSDAEIAVAEQAAKGTDHAWQLQVMNYSQPPQIASVESHAVRGRLLQDSISRGLGEDPDLDTRALITELAEKRAERAELLGYPDHATLAMDDQTVPSPKEALKLLRTVGAAAATLMDEERAAYEKAALDDGHTLGPEDWVYYQERARGDQLGMGQSELSQYLDLDRVVNDGLFFAANRLYGLTFRPRPDLRGWADDVKVWEVFGEDARPRGLFVADYYRRPGKSGGAWMSELQSACGRAGTLPIVTNDANFDKPGPGEPTLLTWDGVETCFHEFGHALHGLLSNTYYDSTAGTEVPADFVELPSQLNEMWAYNPLVLAQYARHWKTGEPLPVEIAEKLAASKHFGQAFATLEYVQAAIIDQYWHKAGENLPSDVADFEEFEGGGLRDSGVFHDLVVPRYRSAYFAHTFAGGYDGAYYSYMWAEAMVAELEEWFARNAKATADGGSDGGLNREAGQKLVDELLSQGNARDPLASFVAVNGKLPDGGAVVRRRGLGKTRILR